MNGHLKQWLSKQKYRLIRNNTGKYHWVVRNDSIWTWYEITNDDYR